MPQKKKRHNLWDENDKFKCKVCGDSVGVSGRLLNDSSVPKAKRGLYCGKHAREILSKIER